MNCPDDVDDRVECAHFVQVNLLERCLVDRGLSLTEALEQVNRTILALARQRRAFDATGDLFQAAVMMVVPLARAMRVTVGVLVIVMIVSVSVMVVVTVIGMTVTLIARGLLRLAPLDQTEL